MALSNWDTFAVDFNGNETNGSFVSPSGVSVDIYKNWIYIRDEKAWHEGVDYVFPTIMQIEEGERQYKDVHITAKRGPQNGIFAIVHSFYNKEYSGMIGAGVYGYDGEEFIGFSSKSRNFLQNMISKRKYATRQEIIDDYRDLISTLNENKKNNFIDEIFNDSSSAAYCTGIPNIHSIDLSNKNRFNQGDAFFVGHENAKTKIGEQNKTILQEIIENMNNEGEIDETV